MLQVKPVTVGTKPIANGRLPAIITPLVGRNRTQLLGELDKILPKKPDLLEWRIDFFDAIADAQSVIAMALEIRSRAVGLPLLLTRRSIREGGEPIPLDEEGVVCLLEKVCKAKAADLVDFEMNNDVAHIERVRAASRAQKIELVLSYHNFQMTPDQQTLMQRFLQAEALGADVAKVAVMPQKLEDVLVLLSATLQASQQLGIPVVSMSMAGHGVLTRLFGWVFGSAMSFAVGADISAPGQVPVEEVNAVLEVLRKSIS